MDKANWSPEEAVQLAKVLNNYGAHYRNAVACLYNTFTYELADYWRGDNYNKVAEFVNSHYDDFDSITNNICCVIPTTIQSIAGLQAENGLGTVTTFSYEINLPGDGAVAFNLIPMTEKSADGSIKLTEELAKRYIDGTNNPSLPYYKNLMEEYMNGYISTLEQFSGIKEFNEALKIAFEHVESYKAYSLEVSENIIEQTRLRANVELGVISDAEAKTKEIASLNLEGYDNNKTNPNSSSYVQPISERISNLNKQNAEQKEQISRLRGKNKIIADENAEQKEQISRLRGKNEIIADENAKLRDEYESIYNEHNFGKGIYKHNGQDCPITDIIHEGDDGQYTVIEYEYTREDGKKVILRSKRF